ncbi:MAG: NAD(P)-dependent oxidoreductase [Tissierellaceae bacterium]|nr:NAD(P)-dependent oxidoreductase [Tissierellaceae bacterium]
MFNNIIDEANRCLVCKKARCQLKCPIDTPIPEIIQLIREGKPEEAGQVMFDNNPLSALCAIVCPHENQCKGNCIKGIKGEPIDFYKMEEIISKEYLNDIQIEPIDLNKDRIAIVGSGPAGLTISVILARRGYRVTLFESNEKIGGVLRYGIPDFRLPKDMLDRFHDLLIQLGVKIRPNTLIGPVLTIDKLFNDGYKAIFIGTGVWNPKTLNIKGESLGNAHYAIDYLKSPSVYNLGDKVAVIGAGNTAMDSARTAKRNGVKDVTILYRRDFESMTATKHEIEDAKNEGIKFELFKSPTEIVDEGVILRSTKNIIDDKGKEKLIELENVEELFKCDSVIIAISQTPKNNITINNKGFKTIGNGLLEIGNTGETSREGVFASGDVVTGSKTVVEAVAHAKVVAESIDQYCNSHPYVADSRNQF